MSWARGVGQRCSLAQFYNGPIQRTAFQFEAPVEGFLVGPVARRGNRQHLLLRIAVARPPPSAAPGVYAKTRRSTEAPQSNCVCSHACLRMLFESGAQLSRSGVVVPGFGSNSSRV